MTLARHAARSAAVLAAATGLTLAGTAAAHATTANHTVDGNSISVTFALERGQGADVCGAVITPTASAPAVAAKLASGDLPAILATLSGEGDAIVLRSGALPVATPSLIAPSVTVTATDVPSNVYSLVSVCASKRTPSVSAAIPIGDPLQAGLGSAQTLSTGDNLTAGSSLIGNLLAGDTAGGLGTESLGG